VPDGNGGYKDNLFMTSLSVSRPPRIRSTLF
jgi:hypothetical protein